METPQAVLEAGVARGDAPFAVGMVADAAGLRLVAAAGEAAPGRPAGPETVLRLFSMTKAVAATAALVLADRGALDLDAPVAAILPDFARVAVLDGWDGETPRLRPPARPATVRDLMTHVAGFAYGHWNADMRRYRKATGLPAMATGKRAALFYPMVADPGTAWRYGFGTDWLGLVIEAAAGAPIETVCREALLEPLGMRDTVFDLTPDLRERLARAWARGEDGGFEPSPIAPPEAPEFRGMGDALYGTAADYLRFLRLFLGGGAVDGVRVLSEASVAAALANQIGGLRVGRMASVAPRIAADVELLPGVEMRHSLIGQRSEADAPGRRRAGSSGWAGIMNTHWWVDPAAGVAAVLATQSLPFMEPPFARLYADFERAVYAA